MEESTLAFTLRGRVRTALVSLPNNYTSRRGCPVVFDFHGGGSNADDHGRMNRLASRENDRGAIIVQQNCTGYVDSVFTWNAGDCCGYAWSKFVADVTFFDALADQIRSRYSIDAARIFVSGFSNGAMLAYRLHQESRTPIAGVCGVGGTLPRYLLPTAKRREKIMHIHGMADPASPWGGGYGPSGEFNSVAVGEHVAKLCAVDPGMMEAIPGVSANDGFAIPYGESRLICLPNGGHTWPGGSMPLVPGLRRPFTEAEVGKLVWNVKATKLMLDFFGV